MQQNHLILKVNLLQNKYVTDGNIWTVDETFFTEKISLFLVINLKTRAILGYILGHKPVTDTYIIELYSKILENYNVDQNPHIVHSDLAPEYSSPKVRQFFKENGIQISLSAGNQHQNQVSESINDKIKALTILELISRDTRGLRALVKTQPSQFKGKTAISKTRNKEYRNWFFKSNFFQTNAYESIEKAIVVYNSQDFTAGMTRNEAEFFNTKIKGKKMEELHIVKSKDELANRIKKGNIQELKNVEIELTNILTANIDVSEKLGRIESLLITGQNSTQELLKFGFSGLAIQNRELLSSNKKLSNQITHLQDQFDVVVDELTLMKKLREEKETAKIKRLKRQRKPQRQPVTSEIYQMLINNVDAKTYHHSRLRIAFCLLAVTGVRIAELLPLTVAQLETLLNSGWIAINRTKRGPSNHKAFLTREGKRIVDARKKDFEFILFMKDNNSYIFSSEKNHNRMLRRESITRDVNFAMAEVAQQLPNKPNISSHSFRIGYITQLWKDTKDIEFVRQAIGHIKVESTSSYVESLPEKERQQKMLQIWKAKDLIIPKDKKEETENMTS